MYTIQYLTTRYVTTNKELLELLALYDSEPNIWMQFTGDDSGTSVRIYQKVK